MAAERDAAFGGETAGRERKRSAKLEENETAKVSHDSKIESFHFFLPAADESVIRIHPALDQIDKICSAIERKEKTKRRGRRLAKNTQMVSSRHLLSVLRHRRDIEHLNGSISDVGRKRKSKKRFFLPWPPTLHFCS